MVCSFEGSLQQGIAMSRWNRRDRIGLHVAPVPRFWAALATLPGFLLINVWYLRALLVLFFAVLAIAAGKRLRWGYFIILLSSVTFFHLLTPLGRVLMEIGPLRVTEGALIRGLNRGLGLLGMVFLSVAAVRPEVKLPGRFGSLLSRTFFYFDLVIESKEKLSRRDFFGSLDQLLLSCFDPGRQGFTAQNSHGTIDGRTVSKSVNGTDSAKGGRGIVWVIFIAAIPWFLLILSEL